MGMCGLDPVATTPWARAEKLQDRCVGVLHLCGDAELVMVGVCVVRMPRLQGGTSITVQQFC